MTPVSSSARTLADRLRLLHGVVFRRDRWNIGIVDAPIHSFLKPGLRPEIRWLPQPARGTYVTDPFGVEFQGERYVFYESFDYREYRGRIFGARLDKMGVTCDSVELFRSPLHLSYAYTFKHKGEVYCVPETGHAKKVLLYKADVLPGRWSQVAVLLDGVPAVDCTIFRHEGRWWLFHTRRDWDPWTNLFAWYADELLGPWRPHTQAPIKSDIASSRPAGTPFVHEGQLYRPAQDSSKTYGGRIVINRVVKLTPTEFEETPAAFVEPDRDGPYPDGAHTLSSLGEMTLIDGKRTGFIWLALVATCRKNLRELLRLPEQTGS